jgi:hypothetical protein
MSKKRLVCGTLFILFLFTLEGCGGGMWLPQRFGTVGEAYLSRDYLQSIEHIPSESYQKSMFNAPYEDVYRAVSVSASQAQLNIKKENKAEGLIFAEQALKINPPTDLLNCPANNFANNKPALWYYYYAIVIKEKGPKSTEVTAMAKAQGRCHTGGCWGNDNCPHYSAIHWASGPDSAMTNLSQLMIFIRNNLIAAGLL